MIKKQILLFVTFIGIIVSINAQVSKIGDITSGTNYNIESKILDQTRTIQIYVPEDYDQSNEKCPVIYVFDSQKIFP